MGQPTFKASQRKAKEAPFLVFDIESKPAYLGEPLNTQFLGGGIYDGQSYQLHESLDGLCRSLLSPAYENHWIYAHNGSGYDFHFLFHWLCEQNLDFTAYRTGGLFFLSLQNRQFLDSMAVIRGSLAYAAKSLGVKTQKWEVPDDFYETIEQRDWKSYLKDDCKALYECIDVIRKACGQLGCTLRPTLASTAMGLFKSHYLETEIEPIHYGWMESAIRQAYVGGRVENFRERMGEGASFDINSSYPFAMLKPVPTNCKGVYQHSLPSYGVVNATIEIPHEEHIPPIPHIYDAKLYFPTGKRKQWMTAQEARTVKSRYGSKAVNVHSCIAYDAEPIFKNYVLDLYRTRQRAQEQSNPAMSTVCKYLMNSLYGKTGMRRHRTKIVKGKKWRDWPWNEPVALARLQRLQMDATHRTKRKCVIKEVISHEHGIYGIPDFVNRAPYILPAIAATITARGRLQLQTFLDVAGKNAVYCDTDSVYVEGFKNAEELNKYCGLKLGMLKRETEIKTGWFPYPKCYLVETKDGEKIGKAKGLSRKSVEQVEQYLKGIGVEGPRMLGIMEKLRRDGSTLPRSEMGTKRILSATHKRHPSGRAFSMEELECLNSQNG